MVAKAVTLDRRLYLNAAKDELIEDGQPGAAYLFGTAGKRVDPAEAKRLGYKSKGAKPAENKEAAQPENKAAKDPAKKGGKKGGK